MKFFLDTASLKDISWATQAGLIDGITTNPSLLSKQAGDLDPRDVLKEICSLVEDRCRPKSWRSKPGRWGRGGRCPAKIPENTGGKTPSPKEGWTPCGPLRAPETP